MFPNNPVITSLGFDAMRQVLAALRANQRGRPGVRNPHRGVHSSRYMPHQGSAECERRVRQFAGTEDKDPTWFHVHVPTNSPGRSPSVRADRRRYFKAMNAEVASTSKALSRQDAKRRLHERVRLRHERAQGHHVVGFPLAGQRSWHQMPIAVDVAAR